MPSRGSFTCRSMTSATISRTRTLIRRARAWSATAPPQSFGPNIRRRADKSSISGRPATNRSHSSRTSPQCLPSAATTATPTSARRCSSTWPASAAATSKRRRSSETIGRTVDLFSFSEWTSPSSRSNSIVATYMSGARLLLHLEGLDDVVDLDVVVVAERDTALETFTHLGDVVLEPAQTRDRDVVGDHGAVPDEPGLGVADDRAGADDAAGDVADLARAEHLADLRSAELHLFELRLEHALERALDILDGGVDDGVVADIDLLAVGELARLALGPDVEADDDRVGGLGQVDVVLGDRADTAADDADADLVLGADVDVEQRILERLHRTGDVALEDQVELVDLTLLDAPQRILERHPAPALGQLGEPLARLPLVGDLAGHAVLGHCHEVVARTRHAGQTQHLHRPRRRRLVDLVAVLVEHRPDATVGVSGDDRVTDAQGAALYEHGGNRTTTTVEVRLDSHTLGRPRRVGPKVKRGVGGDDDRLEQLPVAGACHGRHVDEDRLAAVLLSDEAVLRELAANLRRVGAFLVDLVDGDDNRDVSRLRVVERLDGLRHHAVVGGDDEDRDVRDLRTTGTHGGERLVARCVDEGDRAVLLLDRRVHLVSADVLGDATRLARLHVGRADRVEGLGLSVVDVTHDGDDRRPRDEVLFILVCVELEVEALQDLSVLLLGRDDLHVPAELRAEQLQRLFRSGLGRGHHLAELGEDDLDERRRVGADAVGEVGEAGTTRQADHLAVAVRDLYAADRRGLHVVELLTPLLLRLAPAGGTTTGSTAERTLGRRAASATAGTAGTATEATATRAAGDTRTTAGTTTGTTGTEATATGTTGTTTARTARTTGTTAAEATATGTTGTTTAGTAGTARTTGTTAAEATPPGTPGPTPAGPAGTARTTGTTAAEATATGTAGTTAGRAARTRPAARRSRRHHARTRPRRHARTGRHAGTRRHGRGVAAGERVVAAARDAWHGRAR